MPKGNKILFVCMGNICRSPTAEAVFRKMAKKFPELDGIEIDSCGTIGYHVGQPPDPRSIAAGYKRGYNLSEIRSRKITDYDLNYFDLILAMDNDNHSNLLALVNEDVFLKNKIRLFLSFNSKANVKQVPDPYYGGNTGFDDVIEEASRGLINHLR